MQTTAYYTTHICTPHIAHCHARVTELYWSLLVLCMNQHA